jgi:hypothetical protein
MPQAEPLISTDQVVSLEVCLLKKLNLLNLGHGDFSSTCTPLSMLGTCGYSQPRSG